MTGQQPDHLADAQRALADYWDTSTDYAEARSYAHVAAAHALVDIAATLRRIADQGEPTQINVGQKSPGGFIDNARRAQAAMDAKW